MRLLWCLYINPSLCPRLCGLFDTFSTYVSLCSVFLARQTYGAPLSLRIGPVIPHRSPSLIPPTTFWWRGEWHTALSLVHNFDILGSYLSFSDIFGRRHLYLVSSGPMASSQRRARSSSADCTSCASRRLAWQGHPCFRHAPCITSDYCWDPTRCDVCLDLFALASSSSSVSEDRRRQTRDIIREMIHKVRAVALNHGLRTFVRDNIFRRYFRSWMKSSFSESLIRSSPDARTPADDSSSRLTVVSVAGGSSCDAPSPRPATSRGGRTEDAGRSRRRPLSQSPRVPRDPAPVLPLDRPREASVSPYRSPRASRSPVADRLPDLSRSRSREASVRLSRSREPRSPRPSHARRGDRRSPLPRLSHSRSRSRSRGSRYTRSRSPSVVSFDFEAAPMRPFSRSPSGDAPSQVFDVAPSPVDGAAEHVPGLGEDPLMVPGKLYFYVPLDASSSASGFLVTGLPPVPVGLYSFARSPSGRQVVSFADPSSDPAFEYTLRLKRATTDSLEEPSQKKRNQVLANVVAGSSTSVDWSLSDVWSPTPSFKVPPFDRLTLWASRLRQAKGYGDESSVPPAQPLVPLTFGCEESQRLAGFLQAPPLSPTSHRLRSEGGSRANVEPDKVSRDLDSEYRRVANSSLSVLSAWELLSTMAAREFPSPLARRFDVVLRAFERDVRVLSDYSMIRAVHHRRNMVERSTHPMPQVDVRQAIRDLPLSDGATLVHHSAAQVVEDQLRLPETRRLASLPRPRPRSSRTAPGSGSSSGPTSGMAYPRDQAPVRRPTRPAPPPTPAKGSSFRQSASGSASSSRGRGRSHASRGASSRPHSARGASSRRGPPRSGPGARGAPTQS